MGRRPILINRQPCSSHLALIRRKGFQIVGHMKNYRSDGITRSHLSRTWEALSDDDLSYSSTFIQAEK
jgi:hypothetical protein